MTHLRLWQLIIHAIFYRHILRRRPTIETSELSFIATPSDIDLNFHVNNSVYLRFMDLGRWHYGMHSGSLLKMLKNRWSPVGARVDIQYRKPIPLFRKFHLSTRVTEVHDKRIIFEQTFYSQADSVIYARAQIQICLLKNGRSIEIRGFDKFIQPPFSKK